MTFVPEKSFVGTAPAVTVVREDMNGTKASATYTPTVTPVTPTAEDTTSTDKQGQTQTGTPTFTPGNPNVPMDDDTPATFEDGSTTKTIPGERYLYQLLQMELLLSIKKNHSQEQEQA